MSDVFTTIVEGDDGTVVEVVQRLEGDTYITESVKRLRCWECEHRRPGKGVEVLSTCGLAKRKLQVTDAPIPKWCPRVVG